MKLFTLLGQPVTVELIVWTTLALVAIYHELHGLAEADADLQALTGLEGRGVRAQILDPAAEGARVVVVLADRRRAIVRLVTETIFVCVGVLVILAPQELSGLLGWALIIASGSLTANSVADRRTRRRIEVAIERAGL